MTEVSAAALSAHPFLRGMSRDQVSVLAEAARDVKFPASYGAGRYRRRSPDTAANGSDCQANGDARLELESGTPPGAIYSVGSKELS